MTNDVNCPKCNGNMFQGFVTDFGHGRVTVSRWVDGEPQKAFWTGLSINDKSQIPIATFRCETCGFLENYARPEFEAR